MTSKRECRFGVNCFRVNPTHFEDYSHQHLTSILATEDIDGKFTIPSELSLFGDKIDQQLKIMKNLRVKNKRNEEEEAVENEPNAKIQKTETVNLPVTISPSAQPSTSSNSSKNDAMKANMADFFKERAMMFKTKDPTQMQAPPSPPQQQSSVFNIRTPIMGMSQVQQPPMSVTKKQLVQVRQGRMAEKLKNAAPYNFFLTTITANKQTHNDPLSVTFQELLDPSLGDLESTVQFNFTVSMDWLIAQYRLAKLRHLPLTVFYGTLADLEEKDFSNVTTQKVEIRGPYGCHHTKMMLFFYKDQSMRIVVSTANLYEEDWENRVQGLWISENLPALSDENSGESPTKFKQDLIKYFESYALPAIQPIIQRMRKTDFSSVNVFLVTSVPGIHDRDDNGESLGHLRVRSLLKRHSAPIEASCPIILQASSIGNLGLKPNVYLLGEIAQSFREDSKPAGVRQQPQVKLIYPSLNNVLNSYDQIQGGGCLPYDENINKNQLWLKSYLYQWRASSRNCTRAMPHIKSYCRYSDSGLYWFLLTSSNMSRSAWGSCNNPRYNHNPTIKLNSFETGVMFFPRFVINADVFPMNEDQRKDNENAPIFKLPFDVPPVPYNQDDVPFVSQHLISHLTATMGGAFF